MLDIDIAYLATLKVILRETIKTASSPKINPRENGKIRSKKINILQIAFS